MSNQLINLYNKLTSNNNAKLITRFPPEPSGYLHLGHVKAIYINFELAKISGGHCYLRFDDTNPKTEKTEYIENIIKDIQWLGYEPYKITYTSDYFDDLIEFAKILIKQNLAYVCELTQEEIKEQRNNKIKSCFRDRTIDQNLELFNLMITGNINNVTLRLKCIMDSKNANMRDPVIYRIIKDIEHPRTKNKYNIYPTYDYSHCIVDYLENITHSLCSIEFRDKNELYVWILEKLFPNSKLPQQIEYSKLKIDGSILSKRIINNLIKENKITSWDNCSLATIQGLKNKGITKDMILNFIASLGINIGKVPTTKTNFIAFENYIRKNLFNIATKIIAIRNPILVTIIDTQKQIYIDGDDYCEKYDDNYLRLVPDPKKYVRLKDIGIVSYCGNNVNDKKHIYVKLINNEEINKKIITINWLDPLQVSTINIKEYRNILNNDGLFNENYLINTVYYISNIVKLDTYLQLERNCYVYNNGTELIHMVSLKK
ncbi:glutaminyl-tRNA synthetase [Hokovirus HKV1]|uniref:Glutaminyl-tRNA synthetase n=1 Tax=Hokovirus HKV1 TaxID=1977638 RepID=A0A1V0SFT2_9VIRU|nr:glutaminyl-tRNA synthetase [Hokovirus HKV1]